MGVLLAEVSRLDPPAVVVLIPLEPMNKLDGVIVKEPTKAWLVIASEGDKLRVPKLRPPLFWGFYIFSRFRDGVFFIFIIS